ncbi:putative TetR family transcriptional regulator [Gordonia effusa NBRC 100432]|uniref:Putative TetR family transcriptional regulator n=1 Tax=Gordonia effusa NBRC 100432 TaxID=1077974 RepID=H0QVT4_9ACTN|nr:TetR/AcrR family transcriptional regulator [Gordonia effusa]GAB16935.1 putative TetR family transcriptional regulator [Gordonia effusa NBRC 100432]
MSSSERRPLGRPPDGVVDRKITAATLKLLAANGFHGLSISKVASEAGVPRSTIYRRGATTAELAVAAITRSVPPVREFNTGDPVADLAASAGDFLAAFIDSGHFGVVMQLHACADYDPQLGDLVARYLSPRGEILDRMIDRLRDAGAIASDVTPDMVRDLLFGPIVYRRLVTKQPADRAHIRDLIAIVIRAVAAPAGKPD